MSNDSILGATLGQLGSVVKKTGQQIVKVPVGEGADIKGEAPEQKEVQKNPNQTVSENFTKEVVESLYGKSPVDKLTDKSAEEKKKILELEQQLHKQNYYDPTFNPPKHQDERPAEKVENEKKKEMQELQQKEAKKPPPLAAQRAAQRVEKIPGAG